MKTKTITIEIPKIYKWLCIQPWGEYLISVDKPYIYSDGDYEYWESKNFMEIDFKLGSNDFWKNSLKKI